MLDDIGNHTIAIDEYNNLPLIEDLHPVDGTDLDCLREVRDVLERHGKLQRFGINLLHKHFDLRDGEVMVETTDETNRTQTLTPVDATSIAEATLVRTNFSLNKGDAFLSCHVTCVYSKGSHKQSHVTFSG